MTRLKNSLIAGLVLAALPLVQGCVVRGRAHGHVRLAPAVVVVDQAPPEPRPVVVENRAGYVWVQGRWEWNGNTWAWVDGQHIQSRADYVWVDGQWERRGARWHWVEGRWESGGGHRGGDRDHRPGNMPAPQPAPIAAQPQPAPVTPVPVTPVQATPTPATDPNHAAHEHPHAHPHAAGDHHHHPHAHPHRPGDTHHHPY